MALIAAFLVVIGGPLLIAALLYAAPVRRRFKAVLFLSVPVGVALLIYVPSYTLADIGAVELLVLIGFVWVIGFLIAPLLIGLWHLGRSAAHHAMTVWRP